ncbi:MAG: tyrosine-type recombinase/integrase, partial [Gemmatimonadales bacterium]|nr:tyrosine-type recombinase/integrase [Gemmatimonadales bacterium]
MIERARRLLRLRHYSRRTEEAYLGWIRRFLTHHGARHPAAMGEAEINAFLGKLAERGVSASTQNQALQALLFLYREVLEAPPGRLSRVVRAKRPVRLPVVLTRAEVRFVLRHLRGTNRLLAALLYGSGQRLLEGLRLRVKDVDFGANQIVVRSGKGMKDRVTMLPQMLRRPL